MKVEILGTGCLKCEALAKKVQDIAKANNLAIQLEKVTDIDKIIGYGVMMTPGLVIDGQVKSSGKIPSEEVILDWLK